MLIMALVLNVVKSAITLFIVLLLSMPSPLHVKGETGLSYADNDNGANEPFSVCIQNNIDMHNMMENYRGSIYHTQ